MDQVDVAILFIDYYLKGLTVLLCCPFEMCLAISLCNSHHNAKHVACLIFPPAKGTF